MDTVYGSIWDFHSKGYSVCIPTNGVITKAGKLVMGAGLALEAKEMFPGLDTVLGTQVKRYGNVPIFVPSHNLFSFPTKKHWRDQADMGLIINSARLLSDFIEIAAVKSQIMTPVMLPKVGCGLGKLSWRVMEPELEKILDERFAVVIC